MRTIAFTISSYRKRHGYYSVEGDFYDEEWNQIYSEEMIAGNAYYLAPYGRYWCIKQSEYTPSDPGGSGGKVQVKVGGDVYS